MVSLKLSEYSKLEKIALSLGCLAIIVAISSFIFFFFNPGYPTHLRRTHLIFSVFMALLSTVFIAGVLLKRSILVTPFVYGNIGGLTAAIGYSIYAFVKGMDTQSYIRIMHQGVAHWDDKDVPEEDVPTVMRLIIMLFFVFPAIYVVVSTIYCCYGMKRSYSNVADV